MKNIFKILIWVAIAAGIISLLEFFALRHNSKPLTPQTENNVTLQPEQPEIPTSNDDTNPKEQLANNSDSSGDIAVDLPPSPSSDPLPEKFILDIFFYSQAPFGNWDKVHEEMCEEASVLDAGLYLSDKKLSKDTFEKELMDFKKIEEKELGDYKSNTIAEIKKATDIYFAGKVKSKIIDNPTIKDIESEISAGNPVVVPLAGRDIGNPNFTPPGPVYHMLVIKGYDGQNFITNDVGTRKGDSYVYRKDVIMNNMHDWNEIDIHKGAKKILVLYK